MERLMTRDPPLPCEAWRRMQGWYIAAVDYAPPPARITLERITAEREELYRYLPPPPLGENIPTYVQPSQIDDSVTTDEEVEWVVRRLQGNGLGGPYQMRANQLREWLQ